MTVTEARKKLWDAVNAWRGSFETAPASRVCAAALDAFAQAVRAEAVAPIIEMMERWPVAPASDVLDALLKVRDGK